MRPDPIVVICGDRSFTIRPLTLQQIRGIDSLLKDSSVSELGKSIGILSTALSRDHADVVVDDLEIGLADLGPIIQSILTVGGMVVVTDVSGKAETVQTSGI